MCVICTHEISLIRVAVTHQTLRSYRGCKVTSNNGGGGGVGRGGGKRIQTLIGHRNTAGVLWKGEDEVVHLELFLSIFIDSTHGKTEKREESTDYRSCHCSNWGSALGQEITAVSNGSAHKAASCQLFSLLR